MNPYTFTKKPATVEAWQWNFSTDQLEPPVWMNDALHKWPEVGGAAFWPSGKRGVNQSTPERVWWNRPHIEIQTLEGVMRAVPGDWIIRGVAHEIYPCKPAIFATTYEKAAA
ncbi:hypothetical protein D9M72_172960 [compost metagenome]